MVTFQPIQGQTTQQATVTITLNDDAIALEEPETLRFGLVDAVNAVINNPTIDVTITDDDSESVGTGLSN